MLELYSSLIGLYLFTLGGFFIKKLFKNKIDKKTLTLILVYFFQPILGFWGFSKAPLDLSIFYAGLFYFGVVFFVMIILFLISKIFIKNKKIKILSTITGTIGNTGNIGIPLSGIMFGPIGIVISTMINFFNILWVFIFGVYFYSRGNFSIKKSLLEIIKMPIIGASLLGILFNIYSINISDNIMNILDMGAYCSIVMQLFLMGIFFTEIKIKSFDWKLSFHINVVKFLFLPLFGFLLLYLYKNNFGKINNIIYGVIILELLTPLAVNNTNLAHLYNCLEVKVSEATLLSYILFLFIFPIIFFLI